MWKTIGELVFKYVIAPILVDTGKEKLGDIMKPKPKWYEFWKK